MMSALDVSVIIPAHNEEGNLQQVINSLTNRLSKETFSYELVIVDDNSNDDTGRIADELARKYREVIVIHREGPNGFGRAIKDGLRNARGIILVFVMGDKSDEPDDVVKLIKKSYEGYDVVYGSRFIPGSKRVGYPLLKLFINRAFNNLVRLLIGIKEKDVTNAFKAYNRKVLEKVGLDNLESDNFDILVELPIKAHFHKFKSIEVPVSWYGRSKGTSKLNLFKMGPLYIKRVFTELVKKRVLLLDLF
jgi:hypothetical protein